MAKKQRHLPATPATTLLRRSGVAFEEHGYDYVDRGGTAESAHQLGVPEHHVVKTLVMEDEGGNALLVLMHGDRQVSTRALARAIGAKNVTPCKPEVAQRHTGYQVGGTSPFGTRKALPVYVQSTILPLDRVMVNGGGRGHLVALDPAVFVTLLAAEPVDCAIEKGD